MSLVSDLNSRYPIRPFLVFPAIRQKLFFEYDEDFDHDLKLQFEYGLHDLSIDSALSDQNIIQKDTVRVSKEDGKIVFRLESGRVFRFPEVNPLNSMLWTAYSLASRNGWLPSEKGSDVDIIVNSYNIESQKIASNMQYSIKTKFDVVPDEYNLIKKAVLQHSERFIREVPQFSTQSVDGRGIEFINKTSGFMKKKTDIRLEDLTENLYGRDKSFVKELEAYCGYLSEGSDKYTRELGKAVETCMSSFYDAPIFHLKEALLSAKKAIESEYAYSDYLRAADERLRASRSVKDITPEKLAVIFKEIDDEYEKAARNMVILKLLDDLTDALSDRIEKEFRQVIDRLKSAAVELGNFCVLNPADYGLNIRWNSGGELETDEYIIKDAVWEASHIQDAQINAFVPEGFVNRVWFAGEKVSMVAKEQGSQSPVETLDSLDGRLLCALYSRDNTLAEKVI